MPTTRPRFTITETEPVREALDELRRALGEKQVELPELVIRGARDKVREIRTQGDEVRKARIRVASAIRAEAGVDAAEVAAAEEAKRAGLTAEAWRAATR
jgi:cell division septum initiation protein DivIVA